MNRDQLLVHAMRSRKQVEARDPDRISNAPSKFDVAIGPVHAHL